MTVPTVSLTYVSCMMFAGNTHLPDVGFALLAIPCEEERWLLIFNKTETKELVGRSVTFLKEEYHGNRLAVLIKVPAEKHADTKALIKMLKNKGFKVMETNGGKDLPWRTQ